MLGSRVSDIHLVLRRLFHCLVWVNLLEESSQTGCFQIQEMFLSWPFDIRFFILTFTPREPGSLTYKVLWRNKVYEILRRKGFSAEQCRPCFRNQMTQYTCHSLLLIEGSLCIMRFGIYMITHMFILISLLQVHWAGIYVT